MHSRVTRFKVPPDKFDLVIRAMQGRVDAGAQRYEDFHGFAGETLLIDRDREEALLIAYYQDSASMALSAERAQHLPEQIAGGLGVQVLSVDEYEVAVSDIPSPITPG
jgi:hypothetical protein